MNEIESPVGEDAAIAWSAPEGEPSALAFRIPRDRLDVDDPLQGVTVEDLLAAAGLSIDAVESWQFGDEFHESLDGTNLELKRLLPPPPPDESHLAVHVRLTQRTPDGDGDEPELTPEYWQSFEARWKAILAVEATIETTRMSMEGLRLEMETAFKRSLTVDEKVHALQADVAQWTRAKSRVHYALPKVREYLHRATWALGLAERKRLEDLFKGHIEPRIPFPGMNRERAKIDHLLKDRQVLAAQGNAVYQDCRSIASEIQRTFGALQRNANDNARRKRSVSREKGKHF